DPAQKRGALQFVAIERQADRGDLFKQPRIAGPRFHIEYQDGLLGVALEVSYQTFPEITDKFVGIVYHHNLPWVPHRNGQQRIDNCFEIDVWSGKASQTQIVAVGS